MIHISCPSPQFSQLPALFIHTHRLGEPVLKTVIPPPPHPQNLGRGVLCWQAVKVRIKSGFLAGGSGLSWSLGKITRK